MQTNPTSIGKTINTFMIEMRILELRKTIKTLEQRIVDLEALKDAPTDQQMPNLD